MKPLSIVVVGCVRRDHIGSVTDMMRKRRKAMIRDSDPGVLTLGPEERQMLWDLVQESNFGVWRKKSCRRVQPDETEMEFA